MVSVVEDQNHRILFESFDFGFDANLLDVSVESFLQWLMPEIKLSSILSTRV
jgi:hypothetical protein